MPESEVLTSPATIEKRISPLRKRLEQGESLEALFDPFQEQFWKHLKKVWKKWQLSKVSPIQLFAAAANNPEELAPYIAILKNETHVLLLHDVAKANRDSDKEVIVEKFLERCWNYFLSVAHADRLNPPPHEFNRRAAEMLQRLLKGLKSDPSKLPPQPKKPKLTTDPLDDELLG